jgi:hypothetical protein
MTNLLEWAERQFRVVEQDGAATSCIKLITAHDGEVWETWSAPFGDPNEWVTGAEGYLRSLENEWPNRAVSVCFVALTAQGEVLAKFPRKVQGKNKTAAGAPWNTDQAAVSMAMDNLALTMEKFQRLLNTQLDSARRIAESNAVTIYQQTELIKLMRQNQAVAESETEQDALSKLIAQHGSDFFELAKLALSVKAHGGHVPKSKPPGLNTTLNALSKGKD